LEKFIEKLKINRDSLWAVEKLPTLSTSGSIVNRKLVFYVFTGFPFFEKFLEEQVVTLNPPELPKNRNENLRGRVVVVPDDLIIYINNFEFCIQKSAAFEVTGLLSLSVI
jgi:hypothetical protein